LPKKECRTRLSDERQVTDPLPATLGDWLYGRIDRQVDRAPHIGTVRSKEQTPSREAMRSTYRIGQDVTEVD